MERKTLLAVGAIGVLAAVILAAVLFGGPRTQPPAETAAGAETTLGTEPMQTTMQTVTTEPTEGAEPRPTEPSQTRPAETVPDEPVRTEPEQTQPSVPEEPELFPVTLENGMLTVHSLFQFSGMNPDVDNLVGEDIGGIQMTNTSEEHMTLAEVTAVLTDGTTLTFRAEDVPPGMSVMAFCLEHEPLTGNWRCEEVFGYAEFEDGDPLRTDLVQVRVDGIEITVHNVSGKDLTDLRVICHSMLDDSCFGGTTYHYNVSSLPAGGSTVIYAADCILGMAEVVRVELDG